MKDLVGVDIEVIGCKKSRCFSTKRPVFDNWNHVLRHGGIQSIPIQRFSFTDTTEMALFLAASGNGVALARAPTTDWSVQKLGLEPCGNPGGFPSPEAYFLVYKNLESLSPASRKFRDWLLAEIRPTNTEP